MLSSEKKTNLQVFQILKKEVKFFLDLFFAFDLSQKEIINTNEYI